MMMPEKQKPGCEHMKMPHAIPRGLLRFLIIKTLKSTEMTGTEIMRTLSERSGGDWQPSPGSIYPLLSALKEDGIIETVGDSKKYRITDEGRTRAKEFWKQSGKFAHKAQLGPRLWVQLMDPADQTRFHLHAIEFHIDLITELKDSLNAKQQQRLLKRIEDIGETINHIANSLKK